MPTPIAAAFSQIQGVPDFHQVPGPGDASEPGIAVSQALAHDFRGRVEGERHHEEQEGDQEENAVMR